MGFIEEPCSDVQSRVVVDDADFGALGYRLALGGLALGEAREGLEGGPGVVVEAAVDDGGCGGRGRLHAGGLPVGGLLGVEEGGRAEEGDDGDMEDCAHASPTRERGESLILLGCSG